MEYPGYCVVTTVVCFPPHTQFRSEPFPESVPGAQTICAAAFRTSSQSGDDPLYRVQLAFNGDKLRQTLDCLRNNHWVSRSSSKVGVRQAQLSAQKLSSHIFVVELGSFCPLRKRRRNNGGCVGCMRSISRVVNRWSRG